MWQVLDDCQINLPLVGLLKLFPRFTKTVTTLLTKELEPVIVNFTDPIQGPTILDEQNALVKVIIRGQEVANSIIDGRSGVDVTSKRTRDRLVDTSSIRPIGLI